MNQNKKPFYKFKGYLAENGIKQREIAMRIGMNEVSFSQKINRSGSVFTIDEVKLICDELNISADDFFLTSPFQKREIGAV
ncbi:helix-turn-helix transcriptional regulator [Psychrobacillus sp.]|uniref:helix-turn-helix transcriptional regulator n=1 Tax=Psychrobacillus sp. TaxID=1871623 RepID=UPI0028BD9B51|nr:helix-turn-helix transcriptional regulator [Psychrobacillus sp.]